MEKVLPLLILAIFCLFVGLLISRIIWIFVKKNKIIDEKTKSIEQEMEEVKESLDK